MLGEVVEICQENLPVQKTTASAVLSELNTEEPLCNTTYVAICLFHILYMKFVLPRRQYFWYCRGGVEVYSS